MSNTVNTDEKETQYTYKQLISQSLGYEQSILKRVLLPTKKYTLSQAKSLINKFLNKEAK